MFREKIMAREARGKDVLDIGSVGQSQLYLLWDIIKKNAKSLTGIDTEPCDDPDIVQGNMETYKFKKKFDLVIAGDVLEHVHNQGLFLNNIREHMRDDAKLIITTPNAKWINVLLKPNPTHTLWHDRYTLRYILKQCGFKIVYFSYYVGNKPKYNFFKRILARRQGMFAICMKR